MFKIIQSGYRTEEDSHDEMENKLNANDIA
jgi:hypothetical protein